MRMSGLLIGSTFPFTLLSLKLEYDMAILILGDCVLMLSADRKRVFITVNADVML